MVRPKYSLPMTITLTLLPIITMACLAIYIMIKPPPSLIIRPTITRVPDLFSAELIEVRALDAIHNGETLRPKNGAFLIVTVVITNQSGYFAAMLPENYALRTDNTQFNVDTYATNAIQSKLDSFTSPIYSGKSSRRIVIFDVPANDALFNLYIYQDAFSKNGAPPIPIELKK